MDYLSPKFIQIYPVMTLRNERNHFIYNLIASIMLFIGRKCCFSTLSGLRVYNNTFDWTGEKWSVSATISPPQLLPEGPIVKITYQSSLNLSIIHKEDKYKKGRKS
jgi:hypothetical protein